MSTDFFLVVGQDLKRLGTCGGNRTFFRLVDLSEFDDFEPFVVWDDYANTYTREEFKTALSRLTVLPPESYPEYPGGPKVDFPNGASDEYWKHKSEDSSMRDRYKTHLLTEQID